VWSDEFDGTTLDQTKWNYQLGDGCDIGICGWGNNELQTYQQDNITVSNGTLKIMARKQRVRGSRYTSGRINSKGKADFTYGRFEASIKLPYGDGLWPAFWMLSTNEPYGGWPQSGEIDIMEFVATQSDRTLGYIHYGDLYPNNQNQGNTYTLGSGNFPDDFHVFALEWEPGEIRWFVDGILFSRKTTADVAPFQWPFDQDMHFLLNVAVGGNLGGAVNDGMLPATMEVDYVRVYDTFSAYLTGPQVVDNQAQNISYTIANLPNGTSVNWTVPTGSTIVSGQGSSQITVDFGTTSGEINASFNDGCSTNNLTQFIEVESAYIKDFSFENFDAPATMTFNSTTGSLTETSNPAPNVVNGSSLSGRYVRNGAEQYDVLVYDVSNIPNAGQYVDKSRKFYVDLYTDAPVGTELLLQLETPSATPTNYPSGRHSRYVATITENGNWQRLAFQLLDRPDPGANDNEVSVMTLLFASNSFNSDTYYFDNLDGYLADNGGTINQPPSITITSPANGATLSTSTVVTLSADATDSDGTITGVEFLANGSSLGTDNTGPYSVAWTVTSGNVTLTAIATDNEGATTSTSVSVTGQSAGNPTSVIVASLSTGTGNAGKGKKYGTALVSITDDLGTPVDGALVSGTFSGTFSETVSGTTDAAGAVTLRTQGTASGGVTVFFCVDDVVAALPYNSTGDPNACGSSLRQGYVRNTNSTTELQLFPNPARETVHISLPEGRTIREVRITDLNGRMVQRQTYEQANVLLHLGDLPNGVYLIRVTDETGQNIVRKLVH
jgi:beta-glucanase (GH16 family)